MQKLFVIILLLMFVNFAYGQEGIAILWPEEYEWKVLSSQDNDKVNLIELIPGDENGENWTLLGHMMSLKGVKSMSLDDAKNFMYKQAKETTPCSKLTSLEKNMENKYPWVLFKIESSCGQNQNNDESQLWFIRQGNTSLYVNFVAVKSVKIESEFVKLWSKVFKESEIVTVTNSK